MEQFLYEHILSRQEKMISYADFLKLALYHPEYGYYNQPKPKIGRNGDFITSSNISDIFGRVLAKWFYHEAKKNELPYQICEIGAGNGRFAKAFTDGWHELTTEPLQYYIVEQSPYHLKLQKNLLTIGEDIHQVGNLSDLSPFQGLIFSNELFDALPVHVIENGDDGIREIMITVQDGMLREISVPISNRKIIDYLNWSGLSLTEYQRIEIPLQMVEMIQQLAMVLEKGLILTADYGYTNEEWEHPARRSGSLRGYAKHQQLHNVLEMPGHIDITSHIHFDGFIAAGKMNGLDLIGKWRQDEFLLTAGILEELAMHEDTDPFSAASKRNRAVRSLVMPGGISSHFHFILQKKLR